jgi:hypothetical protein
MVSIVVCRISLLIIGAADCRLPAEEVSHSFLFARTNTDFHYLFAPIC